jgi:hypothetical protein
MIVKSTVEEKTKILFKPSSTLNPLNPDLVKSAVKYTGKVSSVKREAETPEILYCMAPIRIEM